MAVANSIAGAKGAIDGGQDCYINTTVNGIGERAGNADLVAILLAILKSKDFAKNYHMGHKINLSKAWMTAQFASYAFRVPIPINQPGVGSNAFAHASGIHADGVLKDAANYELYSYEELGRGEPELVETGREIITGQYSGISGFSHIMNKITSDKAITFRDADEAARVLELVRYANVAAQKPLVKDELLFIARYPEIAKELLTMTPLNSHS
jgi:homocitrate synthase NifV